MIFNTSRALSWSSINCFEQSPQEWYDRYYGGKPFKVTPEVTFGKRFADSIENDTCEIALDLQPVKEHSFKTKYKHINLIGYADAFNTETKQALDEVKTGKVPWTQKRVDNHGQITMYATMNYLISGIKPEDTVFKLHWVQTTDLDMDQIGFLKPINVKVFITKRTMTDVLQFLGRIERVYNEMKECHAKLSTPKTIA